jgi:hypothetical protein
VNLLDVLREAAAAFDDIEARDSADGGVTWSRSGRPFATLREGGSMAVFKLDPHVAVAATRTPDTTPASTGRGWVQFEPRVLDAHAIDRATAWFASACRGAATG